MKFTKMEGLGNDYIYVDGIHQKLNLDPKEITRISSFHTGIGSDGVIVILESEIADFKMRIFNKDGSEAKMCGNGIRCFAKFCVDQHLTTKNHLRIETLSGIKTVDILENEGKQAKVKVDMGQGLFIKETHVLYQKQPMTFYEVSMGNPHAITFVEDLDFDVNEAGRILKKLIGDVNIEFVKVINEHEIQMRVYERGSEETMACGTGACASAFATKLFRQGNSRINVHLLGGDLDIEMTDTILMTGPATTVFKGEI